MAPFEGWEHVYPCGKKSKWRVEYPASTECCCSYLPMKNFAFIPMPDPPGREHFHKRRYLVDYCSRCNSYFLVLRQWEKRRHRLNDI